MGCAKFRFFSLFLGSGRANFGGGGGVRVFGGCNGRVIAAVVCRRLATRGS